MATSGAVGFAPGQTTQTITVPVLGDTRPERDETFTVTVSSPPGETLEDPQALGTIIDEPAPSAETPTRRACWPARGARDSGPVPIPALTWGAAAAALGVGLAYRRRSVVLARAPLPPSPGWQRPSVSQRSAWPAPPATRRSSGR